MEDEFAPNTLRVNSPLLRGDAAEEFGHYLVAISGADAGKRIEIADAAFTIGRNPDQTLVIAEQSVSRRHARISIVNDAAVVEDLGSTNGTFVDGVRLQEPRKLNDGGHVRVGERVFRYERRLKEDVRRSEARDRELARASQYLLSLLPPPLEDGPVRTDWRFVPSTELGGDAFGYYWLDGDAFVLFMIDVSGHGAGAAMHAVAVANLLRQRALPGVDWHDPGQVLASLNDRFQMDRHNGMMFTMWYGVYEAGVRMLSYSSAGHHPAYLLAPGHHALTSLGIKSLVLGATPGTAYRVEQAPVAPGSVLYLFSDGTFEITTAAGIRWMLNDFVPLLRLSAAPASGEAERLFAAVRAAAAPGPLEDDCSIVVATFS
jgi:serine phosphatase RsbU (regulator of sigma subunit)